MAVKKLGSQTIRLLNPPTIVSTATIVGPKEGEGPLARYFDDILKDDLFGEDSWEKAESKLIRESVKAALSKAKLNESDMEYMFGGDLLNQLMSTSFAARDLQIPFFGLYGACSNMTESLSLAAMIIDGGYADNVVVTTASHFSAAERQFRFPLESGNQRPLTAQWTVTGSGSAIISAIGEGPYITYITIGKVVDFGIKDAANMGAAMAPAAIDTIKAHLNDTGFKPDDYDLIITGDLGHIGYEIASELIQKEGYDISGVFKDCGIEIFDAEKQDTHSGGSGCGCSAVVFCGYLYEQLKLKNMNKIMLVTTGALLSPTSALQGESIPSIAHAITIENL